MHCRVVALSNFVDASLLQVGLHVLPTGVAWLIAVDALKPVTALLSAADLKMVGALLQCALAEDPALEVVFAALLSVFVEDPAL